MNLKSRYRKFRDGGAVAADDVVSSDVQQQHHDDPSIVLKEQRAAREAALAAHAQPDVIGALPLPPLAKDWLRRHPEYIHDHDKNERMNALHQRLVAEGIEPFSEVYFSEAERRLANVPAPPPPPPPSPVDFDDYEPAPRRVSAPPSREVPLSNGQRGGGDVGRITLTLEQKSIARNCGISETEYARQLLRLVQEKQNGNYGGQP